MMLLTTLAWFLLALLILTALYWLGMVVRIAQGMRVVPSVREGLHEPPTGRQGAWPLVSIILPAHNEEKIIETCAKTLLAQTYPNLEIIFVLDRCSDLTAARLAPLAAADSRIRVIENGFCPPDWAGKVNAIVVGEKHARGEWLLFVDADTTLDPQLVRAAMGLTTSRKLDMISLLSDLRAVHGFELVAQPVAVLSLMRAFPVARFRSDKQPRPLANGQFMLFNRAVYHELGGHAAVKESINEDVALARLIRQKNRTYGLARADGMFQCAMYESMDEFIRGWKRIFLGVHPRRPWRLTRRGWRVLISGFAPPLIWIASIIVAGLLLWRGESGEMAWSLVAMVVVAAVAQIVALGRFYSLGGFPWWAAFSYPCGCWIVGRLMIQAVRDVRAGKPVTWGGKQYTIQLNRP
jgi:cellulose synthase/poly-beta-1,6-N-acetylglucosamine synthase-like glycosyltransferase